MPDEKPELEMTADDLQGKYDELAGEGGGWGQHPELPMSEWVAEVVDLNTRLGYWDWVVNQLEIRQP